MSKKVKMILLLKQSSAEMKETSTFSNMFVQFHKKIPLKKKEARFSFKKQLIHF